MPEVTRSLGIETMAIVPYFYYPAAVGEQYARQMESFFGCQAFSWQGFHHEESGIEFAEFRTQYRAYLENIRKFEVYDFPYMVLSEAEYQTWFEDPTGAVGDPHCTNVEKLVDIQPNGAVNFCVDFPDYSFGNVRQASIAELWVSDRARRFRDHRANQPLAVCHRCGAKFMSEM